MVNSRKTQRSATRRLKMKKELRSKGVSVKSDIQTKKLNVLFKKVTGKPVPK